MLILIFLTGCINNEKYVHILESGKSFYTITEALLNANEGDTILVDSGIYNESLSIEKSVILKGAKMDNTFIECDRIGDVIFIIADNVTITDFTIRYSGNDSYPSVDAGIDIRSDNNLFKNINFTQNDNNGIYLYEAHNNKIENCTFRSNIKFGIYNVNGNENYIANNIFNNNNEGISLNNVYNNTISSNTLTSNKEKGIYLFDSDYNMIINNVLTKNNYGIHVKGAVNNTIKENLFISNGRGVYLCCGGQNNILYLNVFIKNSEHAYGYPINQFDNGSIGNYWDDYNGTDYDDDGIGDIPYNATTGSYGVRNVDRYPLMSTS
jgi:parallel beta-helix repeat protein